MECDLSEDWQLRKLQKLLGKKVKRFYKDKVLSERDSYHLAKVILIAHNRNINKRNGVLQNLQTFTLTCEMLRGLQV